VAGEHKEIGAELGHVDRQMRDRLSAVDQHPGTIAVTQLDDLVDWRHCPQRIRHLSRRHQLCFRPEQILELRHQQIAGVVDRCDFQDRTRLLGKQLPRDDIGVVLQMSDNNLIAR